MPVRLGWGRDKEPFGSLRGGNMWKGSAPTCSSESPPEAASGHNWDPAVLLQPWACPEDATPQSTKGSGDYHWKLLPQENVCLKFSPQAQKHTQLCSEVTAPSKTHPPCSSHCLQHAGQPERPSTEPSDVDQSGVLGEEMGRLRAPPGAAALAVCWAFGSSREFMGLPRQR